MTVLVTSPADFNLANYRRISWGNEDLRLAPSCLEAIGQRREQLVRHLDNLGDRPIYGVNVGAGDGSSSRLDSAQLASYGRGLNSATSFGEPLPERVVRGIVFSRLSSFVEGISGVSVDVATRVSEMLRSELPPVPVESTGGSGEILPLGHLFAGIPGLVDLGPKEAMSLVNGAPCAAALSADLAVRALKLLPVLDRFLTLSIDALNAPDAHFDVGLEQSWGNSHEASALEAIRDLRRGPSRRNATQARVSVRITPRCLGAIYASTEVLERVATVTLAHVGDNPAVLGDDEDFRLVENGGFHQQQAIVAIDGFTRSACDLVQLSQHLLHALYQDPNAMPGQENLALGVSYMAAAAWSEEARLMAAPSVLSFASVGQNDVPNPVFAAWRKADRLMTCLIAQLALLGAMASESFSLTSRAVAPALQQTLDLVRTRIPPMAERRDVGHQIGQLATDLAESIELSCVPTPR